MAWIYEAEYGSKLQYPISTSSEGGIRAITTASEGGSWAISTVSEGDWTLQRISKIIISVWNESIIWRPNQNMWYEKWKLISGQEQSFDFIKAMKHFNFTKYIRLRGSVIISINMCSFIHIGITTS